MVPADTDGMRIPFAHLRPGDQLADSPVTVLEVAPCGLVVDVRFADSDPLRWHTFDAADEVALTV